MTPRHNALPPPIRTFGGGNQNGKQNVGGTGQKYWPFGSNSLPKSSNSSCSGQSINTNWSNLNLAGEEQNHRSQLDKNNFEFGKTVIEPKNQVVISLPNHRSNNNNNNESKISNI